MRQESMKLFAQLLETYLPEDSSATSIIGSVTGGAEVVRKLHREMGLAHDQEYQEIDKITWKDIKDTRYGAWILIKGSKAAGAIKADSRGSYESLAFDPATGQIEMLTHSRSDEIIPFLKNKIGKLRAFYVGKDSGNKIKKKIDRRNRSEKPAAGVVNNDVLVKRFRPLWIKAMTAAEADIKGMIATMIKNSSYEKARRRMDQAQQLLSAIEKLETGSLEETPNFIKEAVNVAIIMTAVHYYPEKTGEIQKDYKSYHSQFSEGPQQLLKDISEGDTVKLGTVLTFFKRSLVSG